MRDFLIGLAVGALGTYAALKLIDDETREELYAKAQKATGRAKEELERSIAAGKDKAMRAGEIARDEMKKGSQKISEVAGDLAGKLSAELSDFEAKTKSNK